jgi:anthranilate synthase component II
MILIIDNYDSFTYNLYQAVKTHYAEVLVVRNDEISLEEIEKLNPRGIIISPGPGRPEDAGVAVEAIRHFGAKTPILGVCLGHQAIGLVFGGKVEQSPAILHGKESFIFHNRQNLFKGMPLPFKAGRYHSLAVTGGDLEIIAETADGIVMGVKHPLYPIYGVQFHPESVLTPEGEILIKNFVEICK